MTRFYDTIQGLLSWVVLLSLGVALPFTLEYYNLLNAMDLSAWGKQYLPPIFNTAWAIFALALTAKVWGGIVENGRYYRLGLAHKLRYYADRIDPR